jgi:uncharacterized protein (DUF58 family)
MNREKVRLRPTGLWFLFGPVLGCMWLAAVNYSNNLVYGILYLIGSLTFISFFHTWRNLAVAEVEQVRVHPAFAGGEVQVEIYLRNTARHAVYGLSFARLEDDRFWRKTVPLPLPGGGGLRIGGGDTCSVTLFFPAGRRGLYRLESLVVRTSYPFGLTSANFRLPVNADYFVYPEPKGRAAFPDLRSSGEAGFAASSQAGDDFSGVRPYLAGESLRHVDWKAYARGRPLSVKQFMGEAGHELWLEADGLRSLSLEDRLSQLTLWVVNAEKKSIPYVLQLGSATLPLGLGSEQARRALEALAVARVSSL